MRLLSWRRLFAAAAVEAEQRANHRGDGCRCHPSASGWWGPCGGRGGVGGGGWVQCYSLIPLV